MLKDRTFTAFITRQMVGSKNLTMSARRASILQTAIKESAIDKLIVALTDDNTQVVEEIPAAYFNQLIWHEIKGYPAIDLSAVREKMRNNA